MNDNRYECQLQEWCKENIQICPFMDPAECGFYCGYLTYPPRLEECKKELSERWERRNTI